MKGPMTIKFIPIHDGTVVDDGSARRGGSGGPGDTTTNHYLGFKPGRAGKPEGWLVYGVHTEAPRSHQVRRRVTR